ncbi:MAG: DMT family transporter [Firmicutes bacterium]|nr:DMT family transporter [Bacillota bacterium]
MLAGILGALLWGLETVLLGAALGSGLGAQTDVIAGGNTGLMGMMLVPLSAAFIHDACSSVYTFVYHGIRGSLGKTFHMLKTRGARSVALAALIGGPVGMTGYILSVFYMGPAIGAVASTVYPAIGALLAFFFLKERMPWYRWIFLALTLAAVYMLSYTGEVDITNFFLGLLGTLMCAFGWGTEAVIITKSVQDPQMTSEIALLIRQTVSAFVYGLFLLPVLGWIGSGESLLAGWSLAGYLLKTPGSFGLLALAAFAATTSYLFYYQALRRIGAIRAMALNVTYSAWALVFAFLLLKDRALLSPVTLLCAAAVLTFGLLTASAGKEKV